MATGGTALDPAIVDRAGAAGHRTTAASRPSDEELLRLVAEGRPIKAIAVARKTTPEAVSDAVEQLFLQLAQEALERRGRARCGGCGCCTRRSSTARSRARRSAGCCPGGIAEKLRREGRRIGESESVVVTVLMSDIRGYSGIAERTPSTRARRASSTSTGPR